MPITWDQIGSQQFLLLEGDLDHKGQQVVEITRPGVNGVAYRKRAIRARQTTLKGIVDAASGVTADALITTYKNMEGTVVSVVMRGQTRTNYLVTRVRVTRRRPVKTSVGGILGSGQQFLVDSEWELIYAGT